MLISGMMRKNKTQFFCVTKAKLFLTRRSRSFGTRTSWGYGNQVTDFNYMKSTSYKLAPA